MQLYSRKCLLILTCLLLSFASYAQYFTSGADPSNLKWYKIETENFKIVFSEEFIEKGQYLAKVLEEVYRYGGESLRHKPRKINVLVHSETAYSNGFVTWAPKRIELYNNPNQKMHAQEWLQQLSLHEFRHVVQLDKLNDGFTKMLSYIVGEQSVGAVLGLFVPMWFLEGDAVTTETALTKSGRGRSPVFEQGMKAQIMDKGLYSYEKAMFGSYKDYVPNHYEMGYQLVAGARAKYGTDIWEKAIYNTGRNPFLITPFNKGQKDISGINKTQLYKNTFNDLKEQWQEQVEKTEKSQFEEITERREDYLNFRFPKVLNDSVYIAELSGPGVMKQFVLVDESGSYNKLFIPGSRNEEPFSLANQTICWAELEPDPRWENRMYSVVKCYHIPSKSLTKVTKKSRFFSPSLSPDGSKIAAVRVDNQNNYGLVILDKETGTVTKSFVHGNNNYLFTPSWNKDGSKIVCIALSDEGKELSVLDVENSKWQQLTKPSFVEISLPQWGEDNEIIFTGAYSGTDEIYSLKNKEIKQLTQSKYGAKGALFKGNQLIYSYYTADGYQLVNTNKQSLLYKPLNKVDNHSIKLFDKVSEQEKTKPDFSSIDTIADYKVEKYSKWNLFNIHSWAPAFINVKDQEAGMGATVLSQNLLGTASTSIGYNGDSQSSLEKYYFNFKYQGWYPVFDLELKHGDNKFNYNNDNDTILFDSDDRILQSSIDFSISVPLQLTKGKYLSLLQPKVEYGLLKRNGYQVLRTDYRKIGNRLEKMGDSLFTISGFDYQTLEYSLYFHHILRRSERDVAPRWGQIAEVLYQSTPWGNIDVGSILGIHTRLYFPGFFKHHSIRFDNNYQYKTMGDRLENDEVVNYRKHGDYFSFPRGYNTFSNDRMYSFKGDYIFPLCNPDLNLPGVFYLKRVNANLFYDYSRTYEEFIFKSGERLEISNNYNSTGFELRGEVHAFRFMFPVNIGYRYARLLDVNQNKHEFLMGINISGFSIGK